ncbi:Low-density lipoprotein receptor-related protein 4-like [Oopsacas minuta]|uniref:Low-density lipoprotein receptor-related protein 4-like n=1 Tax=Oopsacas minuta TaxID=111878 RepID=A0AAV7KGU3_9METZ|nr:Low-density lipoprotein receptor-related protein 4-like [Oopsacas minuta]
MTQSMDTQQPHIPVATTPLHQQYSIHYTCYPPVHYDTTHYESTDKSAVIKEAVFDTNTYEISYTNVLYSYLLAEITGIAIEHRTKLLYWTDASREVIEIGTLQGDKRSVLVPTNSNPNFLLLDTNTSKLYWIDTKDSLDGSSRETILPLLNTRIISLAIATLYSQGSIFEYLFYTDGGDIINCYVVDLEVTYILRTLSGSHTSMEVFGDELYWFDSDTNRIYSARITPGTPPSLSNLTVVFKTDEAIREINLVSTTSVTYPDTACYSEGLCSYLCLPSAINTKYKCVCPVGIDLQNSRQYPDLQLKFSAVGGPCTLQCIVASFSVIYDVRHPRHP